LLTPHIADQQKKRKQKISAEDVERKIVLAIFRKRNHSMVRAFTAPCHRFYRRWRMRIASRSHSPSPNVPRAGVRSIQRCQKNNINIPITFKTNRCDRAVVLNADKNFLEKKWWLWTGWKEGDY